MVTALEFLGISNEGQKPQTSGKMSAMDFLGISQQESSVPVPQKLPFRRLPFADRIAQILQEGESASQESIQATRSGEQGAIRGGLQQAGQSGLTGLSVLGESIRQITPDQIGGPIQKFIGDPINKTIGFGVEQFGKLPTGFGGDGSIAESITQELSDRPGS